MNAQTFNGFKSKVEGASDSLVASKVITDYIAVHSIPIVEDSLVHFVYRGKGIAVAFPGEMNGWNPSFGIATRVRGTDLFYRTDTVPVDARVEYKLWVDSAWMLDPANPRRAMGGYGENSDVRMPEYEPSSWIDPDTDRPEGKLDTLWVESKFLHLRHAVIVYTPAAQPGGSEQNFPLVLVTDGIDYLAFGKMHITIDRLLDSNRI
ncbi:MAG TPA: hypothetical protein VGR15_02985, partial [Bacteroidota bacterium]|nr:hypothetical protein [Bacteroidota bacterium]